MSRSTTRVRPRTAATISGVSLQQNGCHQTERGSCTRPSALPEGSVGAEVGASGDQPLEHFRMAVFRRQEERSVPTPGSTHFTSALPR